MSERIENLRTAIKSMSGGKPMREQSVPVVSPQTAARASIMVDSKKK